MKHNSVDADHLDTGDPGEVIVAERRRLYAGEAGLAGVVGGLRPAERLGGEWTPVVCPWLVDRCGMGFSTAKDKLRVGP